MIRKYLSAALCFTTVLNSISFSMDGSGEIPSHFTLRDANRKVILQIPLDEEGANRAYQEYISTVSPPHASPMGQKIADAATKGFAKGFSQYYEDTQQFLKLISKGELFNLSNETILAGLRAYFETTIDSYLYSDSKAREKKQLDSATLGRIIGQIRDKTYWILLLGGFFNNKKVVYVKERKIYETQYDVTTNQSAFFLDSIIPSFVPMRGLIIALAKNNHVNNFFLRRIDELFAYMVIEFYSKISDKAPQEIQQQLNDSTLKREPSLTGTSTIKKTYKQDLTLPSQEQSLSAIWNYVQPYMAHYIRSAIISLFEDVPLTAMEKIGGSALYHLSKFASEYSTFPILAASYSAYHAGEGLTSIPYLDGLVVGGTTLWALNGVFKAALPVAGKQTAETIKNSLTQLYSDFLLHQSHHWIPLSHEEHLLFNLPASPSDDYKAFFRKDYEAQAALQETGFLTAMLTDLQSMIQNLPLASHIASFASSNPTAIKLLDKGRGKTDSKHHDTVAQIKFYRIIATLYRNHQQEENYKLENWKITRLYNYLTNNGIKLISLSPEEEAFYQEIQKHPSYDFHIEELARLAQKYVGKQQEDHKDSSKMFAKEACTIVEAIDMACNNLEGYIENPAQALGDLQLGLSFDEFMNTIEAINDKDTRTGFFRQKKDRTDLANILTFQLLKERFSDLHENYHELVDLVMTTSLGANLSAVQQLELAEELAKNSKAIEIIKSVLDVTSPKIKVEEFNNKIEEKLWEKYQTYTLNYLAQFYAFEFINAMGDQYFAALVSTVTEKLKQQVTKNMPLHMLIFNEQAQDHESAIYKFRSQLSQRLTDSKARTKCYGFIFKKIEEALNNPSPSTSGKEENSINSSRWFMLSSSSEEVKEEIILPAFEKSLTPLADVEIGALLEDGIDAFLLSQLIIQKLAKDPFTYDGSSAAELRRPDMRLLAKHLENRRLSHISNSDDRRLLDTYPAEVRQIVLTHFVDTIGWSYDEVLGIIHERNNKLIQNISLKANPISDDEQTSTSEHDQ